MNTRIASAFVAAMLVAGAPASSAVAQGYDAPQDRGTLNVWGARIDAAPVDTFGFAAPVRSFDTLTTGSVGQRGVVRQRQIDSSAKGGNANQQERSVPQYGNTSGGPAE